MTAVALALHIFGAVVWVGGMFAIYVCLRPALGTLEPPQRLRTVAGHFPEILCLGMDGNPAAARQRLLDVIHDLRRLWRC